MDDPLHEVGGPDTAWTTVNTAENFPGVATPLGWTFWRDPLERGMRGAFCDLGVLPSAGVRVAPSVDDRFSAAVYGRFSANVDCLRAMADLMPGTSGAALEEQLLGAVRPSITRRASKRRYSLVATKMPPVVLALPRRLRRIRAETDRWWREVSAPGALDDPARARAVLEEATERFEQVMRPHSIVTMLGTGMYDQVHALAAASGNPGLETSLITGYGEVEETESAAQLWRVSRQELTLEEFRARHGYHAPLEAEISSRSWREDPAPLERLIDSYRSMPESSSPISRAARQTLERERAQRVVLQGLGPAKRPGARLLLAVAQRYIPLREVGKAAFLQTIDAGRAAARGLGAHLVRQAVLAEPGDVYFLTMDEVTGALPQDPRGTVEKRRMLFEEYQGYRLPDSWIGTPEPEKVIDAGAASGTEVIGIAASAGAVEGAARVVHDPSCDDLEPGEILVCHTTDPSWASYFVLAAAVVIDIGGPLSHGAIVAREMSVPCVINTRNGTGMVRSGDRIRVDGNTGVVQILERAR